MRKTTRAPRGSNPLLLVEAALALLLFGLFVYLYLLPAARPPFDPAWWTWPLLGVLFFTLVGLDAWRRKKDRERG